MAKLIPASDDAYERRAEADLAAINAVTPAGFAPLGRFNMTITGVFVGSMIIERTFDGGATWVPCSLAGSVPTFTAPMSEQLTHSGEAFVQYRARMTAWTSGSARVRFSQ